MAVPSNKHNNGRDVLARQVYYPAFNGGLNLSLPPESIERNELQEAINVEYSPKTGSMRVRGGLRFLGFFDKDKRPDYIVSLGHNNAFFSVTSGIIAEYDRPYQNVYYIGAFVLGNYARFHMDLVSDLREAWGSFGETQPTCIYAMDIEPYVYLLSFGHRLYKYTNFVALGKEAKEEQTFYTLTRRLSDVRMIFNRDERIGVVEGNSNIHVSGIGDITNWETETESDSQYTEVGYKDNMIIQAVVPLSQDLIIFKNKYDNTERGKIYRLVGKDPAAWQVVEVAHNTSTFSQDSVQVVGNDVFYLSESGLNVLSSVQSYGDVKMSTPDSKVNNTLAPLLFKTAKMWNLQHRQQLWILPSHNSDTIWVFDYVRNIWTKFQFPIQEIMSVSEGYATAGNHTIIVYIVTHDGMYALDDNEVVDTVGMTETYNGEEYQSVKTQQIEGYMKLGTLASGHQTLIKKAYATHNVPEGCSGELILGKFKMPFNGEHSRRQCIVRDWKIEPVIKMYGGGCSVSTLGLETVEV